MFRETIYIIYFLMTMFLRLTRQLCIPAVAGFFLTTNKPSAYKKAPLSRGRPKKEELSLRTLPMLTALVTFLTRTIVLRAMRAILFFALTAACKHRPGQHGGRHGQ